MMMTAYLMWGKISIVERARSYADQKEWTSWQSQVVYCSYILVVFNFGYMVVIKLLVMRYFQVWLANLVLFQTLACVLEFALDYKNYENFSLYEHQIKFKKLQAI